MAAHKNNKYAVGGFTGRPAKYKTAKALFKRMELYFEYCKEEKKRPLITGLALFCGFASRDSLNDYAKKSEDFACVVKFGKMTVTQAYEEALLDKPSGAKFALVNIDKWADKTEQEIVSYDVELNMSFGEDDGSEEDKNNEGVVD